MRTPVAKPKRYIGWVNEAKRLLRIIDSQGKEGVYIVETFDADWGNGYRLVKTTGNESYDVNTDPKHGACECLGFLRWGRCKHLSGLRAMEKAGRLCK